MSDKTVKDIRALFDGSCCLCLGSGVTRGFVGNWSSLLSSMLARRLVSGWVSSDKPFAAIEPYTNGKGLMGLFSEEGYLEVGEFLLADDPLLVPDDYSAKKIAWQERLFSRQVSDVIHMRTDEELRRFCGNRHCEKSASCPLAQNEKHTFAQLFEVYSKTPSFASDAAKQVTSCDFVARHYTTMAVVELCALKNLRFAINYNFDTVVEETLYEVLVKRLVDSTIHEVHIWTYGTGTSETTMRSEEGYSLVLHQGGWTEGIESIARHDAIHFFHVHGVSTDWNQEAQAGTLVFSHHSYRDYQSAPFSWSNQVLQYLFSLCNIVGVGFSGVDPNFRYFAANYAASTENDANMPSSSAAGNVTLIRSEDSYREAAKNITGNRDVAGFLEKQAKGMVEKYYKRYYKVDINWVSSHLDVAEALHFAATERCGSTAHSEKINPNQLVLRLKDAGLDLWAGVPDSLLKDLCAAASDELGDRFVIAANEGNAVGIACGWHVATGRAAVVYMQNSGEGNAVNPLLSLADPDVYGMPMLLVIGWRGEPGVADEPQHVKQGKVTLAVLEAMGVPYEVLDAEGWEAQVEGLLSTMREESKPVAFVVRKGAFSPHPFRALATDDPLTREEALSTVIGRIGPDDLVVSTTGKESREVFELREARGEGHDADFLTVGGMGHTLSIAWGMALGQPGRTVWCLDGDGSMLMHMGSLAVFGREWPANLRYVVNVNGAHESVGGQPNAAGSIDVPRLLSACGVDGAVEARTEAEVADGMRELSSGRAVAMVLHTRQGSRDDLGRPTISPADNKRAMMRRIGSAG